MMKVTAERITDDYILSDKNMETNIISTNSIIIIMKCTSFKIYNLHEFNTNWTTYSLIIHTVNFVKCLLLLPI